MGRDNGCIWRDVKKGSMLRHIGICIYIFGAMDSMVGDIKKDARGHGEGHHAHQEEVSSN